MVVYTHIKILKDFDEYLVNTGDFTINEGFENMVLQINQYEPEKEFAQNYIQQFSGFIKEVIRYREIAVNTEKVVVESNYKA